MVETRGGDQLGQRLDGGALEIERARSDNASASFGFRKSRTSVKSR